MSPDMFRGFGVNFVLIMAIFFIALGALGTKGCSYVCNKYEVKIQERK